MSVKSGDYFYCSWGYDQTNIEYLVVVEVSPTGKTAICQMSSAINVGSEGTEDLLTPGTAYGPTFRMKVKPPLGPQGDWCLCGSYPYISGRPEERRFDYFFPTKLGEVRGQTMPQFGH